MIEEKKTITAYSVEKAGGRSPLYIARPEMLPGRETRILSLLPYKGTSERVAVEAHPSYRASGEVPGAQQQRKEHRGRSPLYIARPEMLPGREIRIRDLEERI